jgi:hypothetical protein
VQGNALPILQPDPESRVSVRGLELPRGLLLDFDPDAFIVQQDLSSGDVSENEQWLIDNIE